MYETYIESCLVGPYLGPELIKASSTDAKMALFILLHDFASSYYCNALFILLDGFALIIATRCLYYSTVAEFQC
jgi:hypothetical protein